VETCNLILFHPPLRLSIFYWSRDQPRPGSYLKKREEPGNEVGPAPARVFPQTRGKSLGTRLEVINIEGIHIKPQVAQALCGYLFFNFIIFCIKNLL
jgi:hypothetical protein